MCPPAGLEDEVSRGERTEAMRVWLLGGFEVSIGSRTVGRDAWRLRKAAAFVKLLALAPGHRLHREQIMNVLWPDSGRRAASNNLRKTLHAARRTLDRARGSDYLASQDESLVLCPGGDLWVDVDAFEDSTATARRSKDPAAYRAALDMYAGELLPEDHYEEWAEDRREGLRATWLSLHYGLALVYEGRGEYERGIEALQEVLAEEPTNPEAHAGLMRLYALSGRRTEALAQYERLEKVLSRELGVEPSASSRALGEEISAGRFPPPKQPASPPLEEGFEPPLHNLPASRTSFVGRQQEVVELKRALAMTRLLTLTGVGGSGKTRLALEVARELVGAYPEGVWLAGFAPLSVEALVPKSVADALGVHERPDQPLTDTLVDVLGSREMLLMLDNCEHLVRAAARLVDSLLDACPRLRILATSREGLGVEGEVRWPVSPLSLPKRGRKPSPEELEGYESVRLFVERAEAVAPGFGLNKQNAPAVARICQRLEGIPLAIELAAARVGTLSVKQISDRLGTSLELLTRGGRTVVPRQRTLRGTLDWSYDLLVGAEKSVFRRLSVFAGGWTLEAAEAVAAGEGLQEVDVLDPLSGLVEKSLVVAEGADEGGVRYGLLEPVRQYALKKLEESEEIEGAKRVHAQYYLALAEEAEPELFGPQDMEWLERLETEHDNMRVALSWTLDQAESELGLRLGAALQPFWEAHGHYAEGRRWLEDALKRERCSALGVVRAKALDAVGRIATAQNDSVRTEVAAQEGIELSTEVDIGGSLAASFRKMLGFAASRRGDYERAKELAEESLTLSRGAHDKIMMVDALLELGANSIYLGERERGKEIYEEGIALCREVGHASRLGDCLVNLGYFLLLEGDYERGAALNEEAATLFRERGYKRNLEYALDNLGWAALLRGDPERARSYYEESLTLCKELGNRMTAAESLEGLACVFVEEGASKQAARLFGVAQASREEVGHRHSPEEEAWRMPYLVAARSRLDEAVWEQAFVQGKGIALEDAVEYALSFSESSPTTDYTPEQPPASTRAATLTSREGEVANLVARGLTNRQIASELVLSEHTVATHVRRILKKLGLQSRAQVGSWLTGRLPTTDLD